MADIVHTLGHVAALWAGCWIGYRLGLDKATSTTEARLGRFKSALADKLDSLNGVQRAVETPNIFWSGHDREPLETWQDELDGGNPYVPYQLDTAKSLGPRWVVYMPTEGGHDWYEDCHMFTTEEEAMRAVREAKNGLIPAVLDDEETANG